MKDNFTAVAVVLDRSGSMRSVLKDTIGGFNSFLEDQKKVDGECKFTLAMFDNKYDIVHDFIDIKDVPQLNELTFVPRGTTALFDAIGRTMNSLGTKLSEMKEEDRPSKVVLVVMTDGHENASKEFGKAKIAEMIEHQKTKYNWAIVFIGSDEVSVMQAQDMGVSKGCTLQYSCDSVGTAVMYNDLSESLKSYRTKCAGPACATSFFDGKQ